MSLLKVILQKAIRSLQVLRTEYIRGPFDQGESGSLPHGRGHGDIVLRRFSGGLATLHDTLRVLLERRRTLERDLQIQYGKDHCLVI